MGLRTGIVERLTGRVRPLLREGEEVRQVFRAGKVSRPGSSTKSIVIVVGTDDEIVVFGTSPWSTRRPTGELYRFPKSVPVRLRFGDLRIGEQMYQVSGTSAHPQAEQLVNTDWK